MPVKKPKAKYVEAASTPTLERHGWSLDKIERLSALMKKDGVSLIEFDGLKIIRHPQTSFYEGMAEKGAALQASSKPASDEELLFNPMAGIGEDVTHG